MFHICGPSKAFTLLLRPFKQVVQAPYLISLYSVTLRDNQSTVALRLTHALVILQDSIGLHLQLQSLYGSCTLRCVLRQFHRIILALVNLHGKSC